MNHAKTTATAPPKTSQLGLDVAGLSVAVFVLLTLELAPKIVESISGAGLTAPLGWTLFALVSTAIGGIIWAAALLAYHKLDERTSKQTYVIKKRALRTAFVLSGIALSGALFAGNITNIGAIVVAQLPIVYLWMRLDDWRRAITFAWIPGIWTSCTLYGFVQPTSLAPAIVTAAFITIAGVGFWKLVFKIAGPPKVKLNPAHLAGVSYSAHRRLDALADSGPLGLAKYYPPPTHFLAAHPDSPVGLMNTMPDTHTLALGPARSGKTSSIITTNAMAWCGGSEVVTSTKPDVLLAAGALRSKLGTVYVLDVLSAVPEDALPPSVVRVRWTPLRGCQSWDVARARAAALMGVTRRADVNDAAHWATQGERLLAPCLHAAAKSGAKMRTLKSWLSSADALSAPLDILERGEVSEAADQLRGVISQETRHRDSVISTVATALHPYSGRVLDEASAATEDDWNPNQFLSGMNSLFIIAPLDGDVDDPAAIVVGVLSELYSAVRTLSEKNGGRLPYPTLWILDEVANISPLPRLPQWMAEAAGRGLSVILGAQDYAQLAHRWGKEDAMSMWSNLTNKVVFPGISNPDTLQQLEILGGKVWVQQQSQTKSSSHPFGGFSSESTSATISPHEMPRWPQASIYAMPDGMCLIFRPDMQEPYCLPQIRAYRTMPFMAWRNTPWSEPTVEVVGKPVAAPEPVSS